MAGPTDQSVRRFIVPPGEAQKVFSPGSLAQKVQNFEATPEGTLKAVVGPAIYEPDVVFGGTTFTTPSASALSPTYLSTTTLGTPHAIFHASLLGGVSDTLLIRAGNAIFRHQGWKRSWVALEGFTGTYITSDHLSDEGTPRYPDQFLVMNDKIIWTNGTDHARVITHDGMVTRLGYWETPGAPDAHGPESPNAESRLTHEPNTQGYAWPGRIGTAGDSLDGESGAVLTGSWNYYTQYEDIHGNLSALSTPSNPVTIDTLNADPATTEGGKATYISDLTRQFLIRLSGDSPDHTVATRIYRTGDTLHGDSLPRLLVRVPGGRVFVYPDNMSDGELGPVATATVPVPVFGVMCTHQGRLVIGNLLGDPGMVRRSEPGFAGTFSASDWVFPDSGGSEVTGLASHGGYLLAFTSTSVYSLEEFGKPRPLAQGIGCIAPQSITALPNGMLVWLARDGFYGMIGGRVELLSDNIHRTIQHGLNRSRMKMAVAAIDTTSQEYRCAVAPAGSAKRTLILCFDGQHWRRQDLGIDFAGFCRTDDWRQYTLGVGTTVTDAKTGETTTNVFVLGRETTSFDQPERKMIYRSAWLYGDEIGLTPLHVRTMYIGLLDSYNDDFTVRFYRNGSWSEVVEMTDVRAIGPDDGSDMVTDIAGSAVIGTSKFHDPRLFWRQVPVGLENVSSWAFEIEATYPIKLHVAGFAFDISVATMGSARGRIPQRADK